MTPAWTGNTIDRLFTEVSLPFLEGKLGTFTSPVNPFVFLVISPVSLDEPMCMGELYKHPAHDKVTVKNHWLAEDHRSYEKKKSI